MGKSTIASKIADTARRLGCRVGGISAPEVRGPGGKREGFLIVDVSTGARGWLARRGLPGTPRVGSYKVIVEDVLRVGVPALERALREADLILVDEIGPMELAVDELRRAIMRVLESEKPVVGVVHRALYRRDPEVYKLAAARGPIVEVTPWNRERLAGEAGLVAARLCGHNPDKGG